MNLEEALKLKVGDRVIFNPKVKLDYYSFRSKIMQGKSEVLQPKQEYFLEGLHLIDQNNNSLAFKVYQDDEINEEIKNKTKQVEFFIDNVEEVISMEEFEIPPITSFKSAEEILISGKKFKDKVDLKHAKAEEFLSKIFISDNLNELRLNDYNKYLNYVADVFRNLKYNYDDEFFYQIREGKSDKEITTIENSIKFRMHFATRTKFFIEYMQSLKVETYGDMMYFLDNGLVDSNKLIEFYNNGILCKEEILLHASLGCPELERIIEEKENGS